MAGVGDVKLKVSVDTSEVDAFRLREQAMVAFTALGKADQRVAMYRKLLDIEAAMGHAVADWDEMLADVNAKLGKLLARTDPAARNTISYTTAVMAGWAVGDRYVCPRQDGGTSRGTVVDIRGGRKVVAVADGGGVILLDRWPVGVVKREPAGENVWREGDRFTSAEGSGSITAIRPDESDTTMTGNLRLRYDDGRGPFFLLEDAPSRTHWRDGTQRPLA